MSSARSHRPNRSRSFRTARLKTAAPSAPSSNGSIRCAIISRYRSSSSDQTAHPQDISNSSVSFIIRDSKLSA